jgi:hypothetical protein
MNRTTKRGANAYTTIEQVAAPQIDKIHEIFFAIQFMSLRFLDGGELVSRGVFPMGA